MGYNPQESLENTINTYKYHGYTVRGNTQLSVEIGKFPWMAVFIRPVPKWLYEIA